MNIKTALQALFIFIFLGISWILLIKQRSSTEPIQSQSTPKEVVNEKENDLDSRATAKDETDSSDLEIKQNTNAAPPEAWVDWSNYLSSIESPLNLQKALGFLREALESQPREEALKSIEALLQSDFDIDFPVILQIGKGGELTGIAPSLKAFLLDLQFQWNPQEAAERSLEVLSTQFPSTPGELALRLRNIARGKTVLSDEDQMILKRAATQLMATEQWFESPSTELAYSLDIIPFTESTNLTPQISKYLSKEQPQLIRNIANMALDRLVIQAPTETLTHLINDITLLEDQPGTRAGFFARLDPGIENQRALLDSYLLNKNVVETEKTKFLQLLPNLNFHQSYDVASSAYQADPDDVENRLRNSLNWIQSFDENTASQIPQKVINESLQILKEKLVEDLD